ncbi:MAG TPA: DUF898 family protein [Bradyrhizobium sp.]|nr:DUF898 family protein [Bradyrhizobium sp.]HLZ01795.1 DUF898 family protein [Bradyrhizobium sp.]
MNDMNWGPLHPPPPPPPSRPPTLVTFIGDRGEFIQLVTKGAALELVTAGFYRFWLATDIRRHLWSNTIVDGDAAEYTGRGKELLIGFLFAMAILVPIYLAYFLVSVEAERYSAFASIPLILAFYAFGQFAIYRARRYRLTRTVWRGVRFWMDGSGWAYAWRAVLWGFAVLLTLGLAWPWREAALERYKMRHSWYGDLRGDFVGKPWEFFKRAWGYWVAVPFALILFPLFPFVYAWFKAAEWRWWLSGIRFGGVRLESKLPTSAFTSLYWKVIGWYMLASVALSIYVAICTAITASNSGGLHPSVAPELSKNIPLLIMTVIVYFALILSLNVVVRVYLSRDLWARVLQFVQVQNIEAMANVAAKGELATALGEGFADGLDVAGF